MTDAFKDIEKLETDLWSAADNLRANSKLTSSDYFMPVLGVIFLRHAANRFDAAHRQIEADQASGKMPKRRVLPADYLARRALYLPETVFDAIIVDTFKLIPFVVPEENLICICSAEYPSWSCVAPEITETDARLDAEHRNSGRSQGVHTRQPLAGAPEAALYQR